MVTTLAPMIKERSGPSRELPVTVIRKTLARIALATAGALLAPHAMAADISGAGATFPYPIYAKWADAYKKETRSEEHTSELQSLMRNSYAAFCLKKKTTTQTQATPIHLTILTSQHHFH